MDPLEKNIGQVRSSCRKMKLEERTLPVTNKFAILTGILFVSAKEMVDWVLERLKIAMLLLLLNLVGRCTPIGISSIGTAVGMRYLANISFKIWPMTTDAS